MFKASVAFQIVLLTLIASCSNSSDSHLQEDPAQQIYVGLYNVENAQSLHGFFSIDPQWTTLSAKSVNNNSVIGLKDLGVFLNRRIFMTENVFVPPFGSSIVLEVGGNSSIRRQVQFDASVGNSSVPEFGEEGKRKFTEILGSNSGLKTPRALQFNPKKATELWIVNRDSEGAVIVQDAGSANPKTESRSDVFAAHFMAKVSSMAFGENGLWATCHESRNENAGDTDFMGPTLWSADLSIFAKVNQNLGNGQICGPGSDNRLQGSHMDMLHQSPECMGIAHESGNAYWVFDGLNGNVVRYDFVKDHGPGNTDHSDGRLQRYREVKVKRVIGIASHMMIDKSSGWLYIANTGEGKIIRVDTKSGNKGGAIQSQSEPLAEYVGMQGTKFEEFAAGLKQPSGLVVAGQKVFVSDYASSEIIAYDIATKKELARVSTQAQGIMGLAYGPDNKIWYVDAKANRVFRLDP